MSRLLDFSSPEMHQNHIFRSFAPGLHWVSLQRFSIPSAGGEGAYCPFPRTLPHPRSRPFWLTGTSAFRTTFHIAAWLHPQSLTEMTPLEWCPKDFVVTMPRLTKNSKILNSRRNHDHNYLLPQIIATLFRNIFPSRCLLHCTFYVF